MSTNNIKIKKAKYEKPSWTIDGVDIENPVYRLLMDLLQISERKILRLRIFSALLFVLSAVLLILIVVVGGMPL